MATDAWNSDRIAVDRSADPKSVREATTSIQLHWRSSFVSVIERCRRKTLIERLVGATETVAMDVGRTADAGKCSHAVVF